MEHKSFFKSVLQGKFSNITDIIPFVFYCAHADILKLFSIVHELINISILYQLVFYYAFILGMPFRSFAMIRCISFLAESTPRTTTLY